jgi:hypothetical protein
MKIRPSARPSCTLDIMEGTAMTTRDTSIPLALLAAALAAPFGCGGGGSDGTGADADADTDGDTDADTDTDSDTDTDTGDGFGLCQLGCSAPSACVPTDPLATQTEENWSCAAGYCEWLGCLGTAECQEAYPLVTNVVCNSTAATPTCTLSCLDASDCAQADKPLFDANNWACVGNFCVWTGCSSTAECQEAFPETALVCGTYADTPVCVPPCSTPSNCVPDGAVDLFDAENWACTGGACEHLGCLSTEECTGSAHGPDSICVFD